MARRLFTLASSLLIVVCATSIEETTTAKISTPPFDLVVTPQTKQLNETTATPYKKIEDLIPKTTSTGVNGHAQTTVTAKISTPPFGLVVTPQMKQLNETTATPYKKIEDSIRETTSTGINGHAQTKESTLLGLLKGTAQTTRPGMVIGQ